MGSLTRGGEWERGGSKRLVGVGWEGELEKKRKREKNGEGELEN